AARPPRRSRAAARPARSASTTAELKREAHPHLGAARLALVDLDAVGHLGDERQAETETGAVGPRLHAAPLVADRHRQHALVEPGLDRDGPGLGLVGV